MKRKLWLDALLVSLLVACGQQQNDRAVTKTSTPSAIKSKLLGLFELEFTIGKGVNSASLTPLLRNKLSSQATDISNSVSFSDFNMGFATDGDNKHFSTRFTMKPNENVKITSPLFVLAAINNFTQRFPDGSLS
jgi:hypothetical protein